MQPPPRAAVIAVSAAGGLRYGVRVRLLSLTRPYDLRSRTSLTIPAHGCTPCAHGARRFRPSRRSVSAATRS